ncbi:F-box protein At5g07610-like [Camellia sinensis]|uniref:F-box protein At5g07610-like n=1 Tax=Camellia sinensis TaxID=4442 RepID=UPI001035E84F|nr:F-box protein At5g07610-like [Camellia sinensis]
MLFTYCGCRAKPLSFEPMAKPSKSKNSSSEDDDEALYNAINMSSSSNKHFSHPHNLTLLKFPNIGIDCSGCNLPCSGVIFVCSQCKFFLHQQCFLASRSINHPSHPIHPLTLVPYPTYTSGSFTCDSCGQSGSGFCFSCSSCDFDLHIHCASENTTTTNQEVELGKFISSQQEDEENEEEKMTNEITNKRRKLAIGCTSLEDSLAAEVIISNVDLLTEILLHVPTKSLLRFKCVSKHWLSLISDPQFSCNHARRMKISLISGLYFHYKPWNFKELISVSFHSHSSLPTLAFLNGVGERSTPRIVDSCNGLLLCSKVYGRHFIVCNPTTQKYTTLAEPNSKSSRLSLHGFGAYLAFDPLKSPHYKVVLVNCSPLFAGIRGSSYWIDIYSSESASWKHIPVSTSPGDSLTRRVFWNGAIHWMSDQNIHFRFDVDAETLTGAPMPPYPKILSGGKYMYFGEYHGHLFLIQTSQCSPMGFRILEMDRDSCCWNVKYRVSLRRLKAAFPENFHPPFSVLSVVKGANEKDFEMILAIHGKYISYNLDCKTWKVLRDLQPGDFHESTGYNNAFQFIESLSTV